MDSWSDQIARRARYRRRKAWIRRVFTRRLHLKPHRRPVRRPRLPHPAVSRLQAPREALVIEQRRGEQAPAHLAPLVPQPLRIVHDRSADPHELLRRIRREAADAGFYTSPAGTQHARPQLLTVEQLLNGEKLDLPAWHDVRTLKKAPRAKGAKRKDAELF